VIAREERWGSRRPRDRFGKWLQDMECTMVNKEMEDSII